MKNENEIFFFFDINKFAGAFIQRVYITIFARPFEYFIHILIYAIVEIKFESILKKYGVR